MKATIELTHNEMFTHGLYFRGLMLISNIDSYGFTLEFDKDNLSKLLYFLPQNHVLRNRCQRAGDTAWGEKW